MAIQKDCLLPMHISCHIREVDEDEESISAPPFSHTGEVDDTSSESEASDTEEYGEESLSEVTPDKIQPENPSSGAAA